MSENKPNIGDRITHTVLGAGYVVGWTDGLFGEEVGIHFEHIGTRSLVWRFAKDKIKITKEIK